MTPFDELAARYVNGLPAEAVLNIGCGWKPTHAVNLDLRPIAAADVVASVDGPLLPFRDSCFNVVLLEDVLEHVDCAAALAEVHRVLRPGGVAVISTVHFSSRDAWLDPTHRRGYSARSFDFFVSRRWSEDRDYYFDFSFADIDDLRITFPGNRGRLLTANPFVVWFANRFMDLFELTAASRLFPAANVWAVLRR